MSEAEWDAPWEVLWCHQCGRYSYAESWGDSGTFVEGADICPICGDVWPGMPGPLGNDPAAAQLAAREGQVIWS